MKLIFIIKWNWCKNKLTIKKHIHIFYFKNDTIEWVNQEIEN